MSIVGTQSVSMSDLMKLGPQALGAMAQGQMQSIAPSYMVIAALKALTDQQRGTGAQVPQGTVKDQVLAQAAPPAQAGIGAMQQRPIGMQAPQMQQRMQPPVKGFSGADGESQVRGSWVDSLPPGAGARTIRDYFRDPNRLPILDALIAKMREAKKEDEFKKEETYLPKGTEATKPAVAERVGTEKGRATNPVEGELKPGAPVIAPPQIVAPAAARGVGSAGVNPLNKYANNKLGEYEKMGELAKPDQYKLDIPKNEQLIAAAEKFSKPDEARMKELRDAEGRAGLAAFARGMMNTKNGIGVGAAFGPAAADSIDAKEAKAEKRREYEDRREALATELGIRIGAEAKADYLANSKWGAERADAVNKQAIDILRSNNESTRFGNADTLDREKMAMQERLESERNAIMREANKLQAEVRKDNMDQRKFERLLALQQGATKVAQDAAKAYVEANKTNPAVVMGGPAVEAHLEAIKDREYRRLFPAALESLMKEGLGIGAGIAQPAAAGPVVRKAY